MNALAVIKYIQKAKRSSLFGVISDYPGFYPEQARYPGSNDQKKLWTIGTLFDIPGIVNNPETPVLEEPRLPIKSTVPLEIVLVSVATIGDPETVEIVDLTVADIATSEPEVNPAEEVELGWTAQARMIQYSNRTIWKGNTNQKKRQPHQKS
jgi:hypothetical protein